MPEPGIPQVLEGQVGEVIDHARALARIIKAWPATGRQMVLEGRLVPPEKEGDLLDLWPPRPLEPGERLGSEILAELRADER